MFISRSLLRPVLAFALCAATAALPAAQQAAEGVPVPFSDPARIGFVSVRVHDGSIVVKGENRKDVLVLSSSNDGRSGSGRPVPQGFQRLSSGGGITITEENNRMQISAATNRHTPPGRTPSRRRPRGARAYCASGVPSRAAMTRCSPNWYAAPAITWISD